MKTILCVSHVAPWPGSNGNEIRLQRLLLWLRKQGYRILLVLTCSNVTPEQLKQANKHVDRLVITSQTRSSSKAARVVDAVRRTIQRIRSVITISRDVSTNGAMHALADAICPNRVSRVVEKLCKEESIAVFFAYYAFSLRAFDLISCKENIICDSVEVFSMLHYDQAGKPIERVYRFSEDEERKMLLQSHHIIAIQSAEAAYLTKLIPERRVFTMGIDYDMPVDPGLPSEAGEVIGIIGSDNQANREGLQEFLSHSWPLIRARVHGARLRVAGTLGTSAGTGANEAAADGVEIQGWIEDVAEFYRGVRLVVNPVQIGTGLKIKTVEALAHCRPVVAYPIGCEGIDAEAASAWHLVNDATAMADICITLLLAPLRCNAMADHAKQYAMAALSADSVYNPLADLLEKI